MFVRNSSNSPQEISKIFVRDALGVPQEISKIYVRDASGNAVLVFDNVVITVPLDCPNCTGDTVSVYYFSVGSTSVDSLTPSLTTFRIATELNTPATTCNTTTLTAVDTSTCQSDFNLYYSPQIPQTPINKNYWKKISCSFEEAKQYGLVNTSNNFYDVLPQNLDYSPNSETANDSFQNIAERSFLKYYGLFTSNTSTCQNGKYTSLTSNFWASFLNKKLITCYDYVSNYPIIPGYIIVDYLSENSKSTIFVLNKRPSFKFTYHGKNYKNSDGNTETVGQIDPFDNDNIAARAAVPDGVYDEDITDGSVAPKRLSSIYPFYNRIICFDLPGWPDIDRDSSNIGSLESYHCGQEYCSGIYTRNFFNRFYQNANPCINWAYPTVNTNTPTYSNVYSSLYFWNIESSPLGQTVNSLSYFYPTITGKTFCSATSTAPELDTSKLGIFKQNSQNTQRSSTGVVNTSTQDFINTELNSNPTQIPNWDNINPFSWVLYAKEIQTQKVYPTTNPTNPTATVDDCCKNCAYGPISFGTVDANNNLIQDNACRHIYQLPPINSIDPANTKNNSRRSAHNFLQDFIVGVALNVKDTALPPGQTSKVKLRFTLPAYVRLDSSLKGSIVKMKQSDSAIDNFCKTTHTTGSPISTVFNAVQSFIGINLNSAFNNFFWTELLPQDTDLTKKPLYLSSSSFYYEENRFDSTFADGPPGSQSPRKKGILSRLKDNGNTNIPSPGISAVTNASSLGQYPLIYWSFAGWLTEEHTHYVVLEIEFDDSTTCLSYFDYSQLKCGSQASVHNLTKLIKGISFYPLHFTSVEFKDAVTNFPTGGPHKRINHFMHPVIQNYLIPNVVQNAPDFGFNNGAAVINAFNSRPGFIDYAAGKNNSDALTNDEGGTGNILGWRIGEVSLIRRADKTIPSIYNVDSFISSGQLHYFCYKYYFNGLPDNPPFSYEKFLNKYYPLPASVGL